MRRALDIVGHFGTTFSYATVAGKIADRLMRSGNLGSIANLDPEWHDSHAALRDHAMAHQERSSHVLVISAPHECFEMYPAMYGADRTALFMSPNTNTLDRSHALIASQFGLLLAPSEWCAEVTREALFRLQDSGHGTVVETVPLGVDDRLEETRGRRIGALRDRTMTLPRVTPRVLHLSTDQSWPGRKGTEELLEAWKLLRKGPSPVRARLIVHVPPALLKTATHRIRDLEIDRSVELRTGVERGSDDGDLLALFDESDLVVAPSRCEGFGIMLASALVAGVPLLCTFDTGQRDFLRTLPGWMGIPTDVWGPMAREAGEAPTLSVRALASHLRIALDSRTKMLSAMEADDVTWEDYTWRRASLVTAGLLIEWLGKEDRPT